MSLFGTKKLVVVGGLLSASVLSSLTSCSTVLSKVPAEKLNEPIRSMVLDAREERAKVLKQYSVGSAQMLDAQAILLTALGYEEQALKNKKQAQEIEQAPSSESDAQIKKGKKIGAEHAKLISKSKAWGNVGQTTYNKHVRLRSTARDKQFNLLINRAIPEIAVLTKALEGASMMEKAAIAAQADLYIAVITDFKKIDKAEEDVDAKAKEFGLAVEKRKDYKIDAALKKAVPKSGFSF